MHIVLAPVYTKINIGPDCNALLRFHLAAGQLVNLQRIHFLHIPLQILQDLLFAIHFSFVYSQVGMVPPD